MLALWLGVAVLLSACGEDDYQYPDLVTELGELTIDEEGLGDAFVTDGGLTFDVSYLGVRTNVTDTVLRCYCQYAETDEGVSIYTLNSIYCAPPTYTTAEYTDPVDIISAWTTSRYMNMYVGVLTGEDVEHDFAFSLDSVTWNISDEWDLTWTVHHTLIHRASDDAQYYTERSYISFPLFWYSAFGVYDSVQLTVNTYDGIRSFTAPIP